MEDLNAVVGRLIEQLERQGSHDAAARLRSVTETAYTTSSEWLGELGAAMRDLEHEPLNPETARDVRYVMHQVRQVWPGL